MSDSVGPQRWQPTKLPCPWNSPGKNTGVACHFLLQCMKVKSESEVTQLCPTLSDPMECSPPGSSVHGILQARILEWVLSPGIFPTQGSNPGLPHCRRSLYQLKHQGSPRIRVSLSLGEGNGTPLQYSCLENPIDRGAWWAAVHGVAKSQTRLSDFTFTFHFHA